MSDEFREWISEELTRRGWTYAELARLAGVSRPLVSRTLAGDVSPSADFCIKVATALDISPVYALQLADHLPKLSMPVAPGPITTEIITTLETLPAEHKHFFLKLLQLTRGLPPVQQKQLLDYARFIYQNRE